MIFFSTVELPGQDISESELEKYQEIRESLIQNGFLHKPADPSAFPSIHSESLFANARYTKKNFSVATTNTRAHSFNTDGTRFYILGRNSLNVIEYHLSEPWEIETAIYVRELDISPEMGSAAEEDPVPNGIYIRKDDGEKMWVLNRSEIWEYSLSTPWNITSAAKTGYKDLSDHVIRGHDIDFKPDGTVLYVDDRLLEVVFQFYLSTSWDVATVSLDFALDISDQQEGVRGTIFNPNGDRMFLMDTDRQELLGYLVSSPYDLETASFIGAFSVSSQSSQPRGITFSNDLSSFYVSDSKDNMVFQYRLLIPDQNESSVTASVHELEADGQDRSTITVTLRSEEGDAIPGEKVELMPDGGDSQIEPVQDVSDNNGNTIFRVRSSTPESVTYSAMALSDARNVGITETQTVNFLPLAPVALTATNVGTTNFTANWEFVSGATSYLLDVSDDNEFESFVYESENVGFVTDYELSGLNAGTNYYYRVRSVSDGLLSSYSETTETTTFPGVPAVSPADDIIATKFTARWQAAPGAREYILDVAQDQDFNEFVPGFENEEVGDQLSHVVSGLFPGTSYYYRVRSKAFSRTSESSEISQASTVEIGLDQSEVTSSQLRVFANGQQENMITVTLRDMNGNPIPGEHIFLEPESGTSQVEAVESTTNENGQAVFAITNMTAEEVRYQALVSERFGVGSVTVEFLPVEEELALGNNFPNPFMDQTNIPITVPQQMHVRVEIVNVLGANVQTLVNEELETGYYEIPVDLRSFSSGVYFYRMFTNEGIETKKMLFVR